MGAMKNALIEIWSCDECKAQGWLSFDSGDGTPDWVECKCNPYKLTGMEHIFEGWGEPESHLNVMEELVESYWNGNKSNKVRVISNNRERKV